MKRINIVTMMLLMAAAIPAFAQQVGETAPDFEVGLLGGEQFRLSDHSGKVVAVFFFGNTCPSCRAVGSIIESSINQAFNSDSAHFITVGIDTWDTSSNESSVSGFKSSTGITFPLAIKGGAVAAGYKTTYDRLMVIDKDGILVHKGIVVASNDVNNTIAAIEESLALTGLGASYDNSQLSVYPNPVADVLHVVADELSISDVVLYDVTGKQVLRHEVSTGLSTSVLELSLSGFEPGVYFYSILSEGVPSTGKLIIQR